MEEKTKQSFFDQVTPRFAFWSGVVVMTAVASLLGFIIMLSLTLSGSSSSKTATTKTTGGVEKTAATAPAAQPTAPPKASGTVDIESLDHVRGTGSITVVEYSDPECPFCKRFHPTMQQVMDEYDGKVRWAYKQFPLTSLHPKAPREAEATECAGDQDKFWEYVDELFEVTPSNNQLADSELFSIADTVGLNSATFTDCLESGKYTAKVTADSDEAQALGATGTPFSVVIDESGEIIDTIPGALPFESVASVLDQYVQ